MDGDAKINFNEFKAGLQSSKTEASKQPTKSKQKLEQVPYNPIRAKSVSQFQSLKPKAIHVRKSTSSVKTIDPYKSES